MTRKSDAATRAAHLRFVDEYFVCGFNATEAYRRVYGRDIAGAKQSAYNLLRRDDVRELVAERLKESTMDADEALARLSEFARGSIEPFLLATDDGYVSLQLGGEGAQDNLHLIKKLKQVRTRKGGGDEPWEEERTEIELHDAKDALVQIAKIRGLYVDRVEHTGNVGVVLLPEIPEAESQDG